MSHDGFVTAVDGASVHYRVLGAGEPTLLLCDGVGCAGFVWRYLLEAFRDRHRIVHWHYRGHGLSDPPRDAARLEIADLADDACRVLEHVGAESAVFFGHSMGVQVILESYRRAPERVAALVPICGSYGHVLDTFHGTQVARTVFPYVFRLVTAPGTQLLAQVLWSAFVPTSAAYALAELVEINPKLMRRDDFRPYLEHLGSMDLGIFVRCLEAAARHTAEDLLPRIRVPVLVVAGERDNFTPLWLSERMQREIPGAELLLLPTGTHAAPVELPDLLNLRVEKFLCDHFGAARSAAAE
jgi:pimeloyl-ACP methyl ester carboxylesterase